MIRLMPFFDTDGGAGAAVATPPAAPAAPAAVTPPPAAPATPEPASTAGQPAAAPKAPEKYALTLPEGGRLSADDLTQIEAIARASNWSNDDAQAAVAEHDALIKAQSERFLVETTADPEVGGDKLAESQRLATAVIDRIFPKGDTARDPFLAFLNRAGANQNVHVVRAFARIGKLMAEDSVVGGKSSSGAGDDFYAKHYPNTPKL